MTKEDAAQWLDVIKGLAEGKTVQFLSRNLDGWEDIGNPSFCSGYKYRLKPESSFRPWKPEEVPVGAQYKDKCAANRHLITGVTAEGNICLANTLPYEATNFTPEQLFCVGLHSLDNGKTWLPCGVEE